MDPHTARCLQLSTSAGSSLNQYRARRYSESINGTRVPSKIHHSRLRPDAQSATNLGFNVWPTPSTPSTACSQPFTPATPLDVPWPTSYQFTNIQDVEFGKLARPGSARLTTAVSPSFEDAWGTYLDMENNGSAKKQGLGMDFLGADVDFRRQVASAGIESSDHFARVNDWTPWEVGKSMSPDRQSLSSMSSEDALSDLPEFSDPLSLLNMTPNPSKSSHGSTFTFDSNLDLTRGRRRSLSHAPVSRPSSSRRFRRSPYSVDHTRRSSLSTNSSISTFPLSLPATSCCSPVEELRDDFSFDGGGPAAFASLQNTPASSSTTAHLTSPATLDSCFTAGPIHRPQTSFTTNALFTSPPTEGFPFQTIESDPFLTTTFANCHSIQLLTMEQPEDAGDEPDLFGALFTEQSAPSDKDMKPDDIELVPSEQDVRFEGDLYTPRFVRGHGNKREGYCGLCKPGRWLVLKNSAFWYDKSFSHGISAATGQPFEGPQKTRRMHGNPDVWEGLCGTCNEWIALVSNKKKGTTWFRHAYKCHAHQKTKEAPRKRRDTISKKSVKGQSSVNGPVSANIHIYEASGEIEESPTMPISS